MRNKSKTKQFNYSWVILGIVYLATVTSGIIMNKVSPVIPVLIDVMGITISQSGMFMSAYALTSVILAIPAGILLNLAGEKITAILAFLFLIIGTGIGAVAESFSMLLLSRMVEGIGSAFIVVLGPAMVANWFPPDKSGTPVGIWSTATPVGGFIALTFIPRILEKHSWNYVWWLVLFFSLFSMIMFLSFFKPSKEKTEQKDSFKDIISSLKEIFRNKNMWLAGLSIMCFTLTIVPVVTYYPTFLVTELNYDLKTAGFLVGLISLVTIPFSPLTGWLSDLIKSRKKVVVFGFLLLSIPLFSMFRASGWLITLNMILLGISVSSIPTPLFAAVQDLVKKPKMIGFGMAVLTIGLNLGTVISAPVFGKIVENVGWDRAANVFLVFAFLGVIVTLLNKEMDQSAQS